MANEGALGEAVLDLDADTNQLRQTMGEARSIVMESLESIADVVGPGTIAIIAAIAALGAGVLIGMKIGLDATLAWSKQLDTLNDILGLTGEEATTFAVAMGTVGLSVDEGIGQISIFVKNLDASRTASRQAVEQYDAALTDLVETHLQTTQTLLDNWNQIQEDARDRSEQIETDLADDVVKINASLNKQLTQMLRDRNKQIASEAKAALQIEKDAQKALSAVNADESKSLAALKKSTDKSLAQIDKDTQAALKTAGSRMEREKILEAAAERKQDLQEQRKEREQAILDAAADRRTAIAEQRQEHAQALVEQKQAAKEEYDYRVRLQKDAAAEQIRTAEVAADKQSAAVEKMLAKQAKLYEAQQQKEDLRFEQQADKLGQQLAKADASNPMAKALKRLGVDALDAEGNIRPINDLLPEIMDAFKALPKGAEASAIAMQLFGKGGGKFLDFLRLGSEGLKTARDEAIAWGLITSTEALDAAEQFEQSLNKLNLAFLGVKKAIGDEALPVMKQLIDGALGWLMDNMPAIRASVAQFFDWLLPKLQMFGDAIKTGDWSKIGDDFLKWLNDPKTGVLVRIGPMLEGVTGKIKAWSDSKEGKATIKGIGESLGQGIMDGIKSTFENKDVILSVGNGVVGMLNAVINGFRDAIAGIGADISTDIANAIVKKFTGSDIRSSSIEAIQGFLQDLFTLSFSPGSAGTVVNKWLQTRDAGGPVNASQSYLIGVNRRPEIFTPGVSGMITPISNTHTVGNVTINVNGARDPRQTAIEVRNALRNGVWE